MKFDEYVKQNIYEFQKGNLDEEKFKTFVDFFSNEFMQKWIQDKRFHYRVIYEYQTEKDKITFAPIKFNECFPIYKRIIKWAESESSYKNMQKTEDWNLFMKVVIEYQNRTGILLKWDLILSNSPIRRRPKFTDNYKNIHNIDRSLGRLKYVEYPVIKKKYPEVIEMDNITFIDNQDSDRALPVTGRYNELIDIGLTKYIDTNVTESGKIIESEIKRKDAMYHINKDNSILSFTWCKMKYMKNYIEDYARQTQSGMNLLLRTKDNKIYVGNYIPRCVADYYTCSNVPNSFFNKILPAWPKAEYFNFITLMKHDDFKRLYMEMDDFDAVYVKVLQTGLYHFADEEIKYDRLSTIKESYANSDIRLISVNCRGLIGNCKDTMVVPAKAYRNGIKFYEWGPVWKPLDLVGVKKDLIMRNIRWDDPRILAISDPVDLTSSNIC